MLPWTSAIRCTLVWEGEGSLYSVSTIAWMGARCDVGSGLRVDVFAIVLS